MSVNKNTGNHYYQRNGRLKRDKSIDDAIRNRSLYSRVRCGVAMVFVWIMLLVVISAILAKLMMGAS